MYDPYKIYGGWVGGIRRISTLLPSLRSVLSPCVSLSLTQPDSLLNIPGHLACLLNKITSGLWVCVLKVTATIPPHRGRSMGLSHTHATQTVFRNQHTFDKSILQTQLFIQISRFGFDYELTAADTAFSRLIVSVITNRRAGSSALAAVALGPVGAIDLEQV